VFFFTKVLSIKVLSIMNDFGLSQVGVINVYNITCCTTIHGDGESGDNNTTKCLM